MALIECADCQNEISDNAAACPKCGAPVPVSLGPDQEVCPHCETVVSSSATTCRGCGAKKGYMTNNKGVLGKAGSIGYGLVLPAVLTAVFPPAGIILVPIMLYVIWRLYRGPLWYTTRNPTR